MHLAGVQVTFTLRPRHALAKGLINILSPASSSKDPQARGQAGAMYMHRRVDAAQTACSES